MTASWIHKHNSKIFVLISCDKITKNVLTWLNPTCVYLEPKTDFLDCVGESVPIFGNKREFRGVSTISVRTLKNVECVHTKGNDSAAVRASRRSHDKTSWADCDSQTHRFRSLNKKRAKSLPCYKASHPNLLLPCKSNGSNTTSGSPQQHRTAVALRPVFHCPLASLRQWARFVLDEILWTILKTSISYDISNAMNTKIGLYI